MISFQIRDTKKTGIRFLKKKNLIMYTKTEFTKTGIYHIIVGILGILFIIGAAFFFISSGNILFMEISLENTTMNSTFNMITLKLILPFILMGSLLIYLGVKAQKANKNAILGLIIINALQMVNFHLGNFEYQFMFGPHFQIDVIHWGFHFGFTDSIRLDSNSIIYSNEQKFFKINFINFVFVAYLIDQIRFIPKQADQPLDTEFTS